MSSARPSDDAFAPGATVDRYRVEGMLGEGGMGAVYAVVDPAIGRRFALKVLRRVAADDPAFAARLEREARATADVHHPGIVEVLAFGRLPDGRPYLVMPLLEGRTLREELEARTRLPPREAWTILRAVAGALGAAHEAGVVHRDLKPENVFLERSAGTVRPRLLDFGIAKVDPALASDPDSLVKLTQTGVPIGTPIYMAPEQWWSKPVDGRTDQYAFGVVLFELLTGKPPFASRHFAELLQQHLHEEPPALTREEMGDRPEVGAFVARLLQKRPEDRCADFTEVLEAGDAAFGLGVAAATTAPRVSGARALASEGEVAPTQLGGPPPDADAFAPTVVHDAADVVHATGSAARAMQAMLRRIDVALVACLVFGCGLLLALGYPGPAARDVGVWVVEGGWGMLVLPLVALGALGVLRAGARQRARRRSNAYGHSIFGLGPLLAAALPTYTGIVAVADGAARLKNPTRAFYVVMAGTHELNSGRFVAFGLGIATTLAATALPGIAAERTFASRGAPRATRLVPVVLSLACAGFGVLALLRGEASLCILPFTASAVWALDRVFPIGADDRARRDLVHRGFAGVATIVAGAGLGLARLEAATSWLWQDGATRSERVRQIIARANEQTRLSWVSVALVAVFTLYVAWRVRAAPAPRIPVALPKLAWVAVGALIVSAAIDVAFQLRFRRSRHEHVAAVGESLAVGFDLVPPRAPPGSRATPTPAPAIQMTTEVVALDGRAIARVSALDTASVQQSVVHDVSNAAANALTLEQHHLRPDAGVTDLGLIADRAVPWRRIATVLTLAREAGVSRVQLLLSRGDLVEIPADAPREAGFLLPTDFVPIDAVLTDDGFAPGADVAYAEAVTALPPSEAEGVRLRTPKR